MIRFAASKCDRLTVLACCSDRETIPDSIRKAWIEKTFEGDGRVEVMALNYLESDFPNTSVSDQQVSKVWSEKFKEILPDHQILVTSEEYGNYVASFMGIEHIAFDGLRQIMPVSATAIRNDLFLNWKFLPDSVKPFYSIKVVILGTEGTGKSVLSEKLAKHYGCNLVEETGRDLIADSKSFVLDDLRAVAVEHARRIEKAVVGESPITILDTDIHITQSYARFAFQKELVVDESVYRANRADLYLYLRNDVEPVQDHNRLEVADRDRLDRFHREVMRDHHIGLVEIGGNWEKRTRAAIAHIDQLIEHKKSLFSNCRK